MIKTTAEIDARLAEWLVAVENFINEDTDKLPYRKKLEILRGSKNAKIAERSVSKETGEVLQHSGSVYCFIDLATGDILKAASWKAPAKGVRGSIFDDNFSIGKGVGRYGAAYLR